MSVENNSVTIDIRQPRTYSMKTAYSFSKKKSVKQTEKVYRKPSESSIKKYTLTGNKPLCVDSFKRSDLLLPSKLFSKSQEKERHRQRLAVKIDEQYKIISTDLRNRLHVAKPSNDICAITDVDTDFFHCFGVRPSFNYAPAYKSFKCLLNKQLRVRQELAYLQDNILNIEENHKKELKAYDDSAKKCAKQAKLFDSFISADYQESMTCLAKWNELTIKLNMKISELQCLAGEMFTTQSKLVGLDYMYGLQQKYGRFLYYLSPPSWRCKNREFARSVEIEAKGFDFGISSEDDTFTAIFENMKKECSTGLIKPALYFSHPDDLMHIFEGIEKQQLHHFTQVEQVVPHTKSLKEGIKMLKEMIALDSISINNTIKSFETLLNFDEERCAHLEASFLKLVYGSFYNSVGSPEVLQLKLHLEFCFEKVFSEKPINMDIVTLAKALEKFYMDYNKQLDAINSGKIKAAVLKCIERERLKFRRAKIAARELRYFGRLERDLRRACEPPASNSNAANNLIRIPVVHRVVEQKKYKRRPTKTKVDTSRKYSLTDAEKEYLSLFTDWTENEDPANYLHSLSISKE